MDGRGPGCSIRSLRAPDLLGSIASGAEQAQLYKSRHDGFPIQFGKNPISRHAPSVDVASMTSTRLRVGRHSEPGAWYAITTITALRRPLFALPGAVDAMRAEISACEDSGMLDSFAWVAMPDHLHWLFQLRKYSLGCCLQTFKSRSARAIRRSTGGNGPVWQPGYYDHRLRNEEDLMRQARYIVANPLRAGLVQRIEDYPYWWARSISTQEDLL